MVPHIEFVAFDEHLVLTKETWVATRLYCPRCAGGAGTVWCCTSDPPLMLQSMDMRRFICAACSYAGLGLGGFKPTWSVADRVKQIMKHGFGEVTE